MIRRLEQGERFAMNSDEFHSWRATHLGTAFFIPFCKLQR
jgi:hypothetical protein